MSRILKWEWLYRYTDVVYAWLFLFERNAHHSLKYSPSSMLNPESLNPWTVLSCFWSMGCCYYSTMVSHLIINHWESAIFAEEDEGIQQRWSTGIVPQKALVQFWQVQVTTTWNAHRQCLADRSTIFFLELVKTCHRGKVILFFREILGRDESNFKPFCPQFLVRSRHQQFPAYSVALYFFLFPFLLRSRIPSERTEDPSRGFPPDALGWCFTALEKHEAQSRPLMPSQATKTFLRKINGVLLTARKIKVLLPRVRTNSKF